MKLKLGLLLSLLMMDGAFGQMRTHTEPATGTVTFSESEIEFHAQMAEEMAEASAKCLTDTLDEHYRFFESHCKSSGTCLSKYFGNRKYSKSPNATRAGYDNGQMIRVPLNYVKNELVKEGFTQEQGFDLEQLMQEMEPISCIDLAMKCLKKGFEVTGQMKQWEKVQSLNITNGTIGTALIDGLRRLGWKVYYWNPQSSQSSAWDAEEKGSAARGDHAAWYRYATQGGSKNIQEPGKGFYWAVTVDDAQTFVDFDKDVPDEIWGFPFWVGTANVGYHVFPGVRGTVIEGHSSRPITSFSNIEVAPFNPLLNEEKLGSAGPMWTTTERYRSGLMAVPPHGELSRVYGGIPYPAPRRTGAVTSVTPAPSPSPTPAPISAPTRAPIIPVPAPEYDTPSFMDRFAGAVEHILNSDTRRERRGETQVRSEQPQVPINPNRPSGFKPKKKSVFDDNHFLN